MIYFVIIPVLLAFVPWFVVRYILATKASRQMTYGQAAPYLLPAAACWEVAMQLPVIHISNETQTFGMHSFGGIVACILFYFALKAYRLTFDVWWQKPLMLYFFASGLGVLNELFELLLNKTGVIVEPMHAHDTWWDLTANTLGAAVGFIAIEIYRRIHSKS